MSTNNLVSLNIHDATREEYDPIPAEEEVGVNGTRWKRWTLGGVDLTIFRPSN